MSNRSDATAIVLAGGRSKRFGGPKLHAVLAGEPLLDHALRAVAAVAGDIIVVGGTGPFEPRQAFGAGSIRVISDAEPFGGPLPAVAAALRETTTALAIVVGGDMPGLVPNVLDSMLDRLATSGDVDATILASPAGVLERRQVLPLALRVGPAFATAAQALQAGDRSLVRLVERLGFVAVPASEWLVLDPAGRTLLDVDRPEDLERIQQNFR